MLKKTMASVLGLTIAIAAAAGFAAGDDVKPCKVGEKASNFTLTDLNGKEVSLKDYEGKIVVLQWVNPGCPVCVAAHKDGRIGKMIEELKGMEVVHLAINSTHNTNVEENKKALEGYKAEYTVLLDTPGKVGKMFDAKTTPHLYVIDTEGVLRYSGAIDNLGQRGQLKEGDTAINYAVQAVKQIKAGETVSPETTKPYGCTVKYAKN